MRFHAFIILLLCLLLSVPAVAETAETAAPAPTPDLSGLNIMQLLDLREQVERALLAQGYNPYFDIERGARSEQVSRIQERLTELGFYNSRITGQYDSATMKAFKQFEKAHNLNNDGLASREDQAVLFSLDAQPMATATPKPTVTRASGMVIPDEKDYGSLDYKNSLRYPEQWYGKKVKLYGSVLQVVSGSRSAGFQILMYNGSDLVYVTLPEDLTYNILEGDILLVYGAYTGTYSYTTVKEVKNTVPYVNGTYVVLK